MLIRPWMLSAALILWFASWSLAQGVQGNDPPGKNEPMLPNGLKALKHPDPEVRYRAALILARLGSTAKFAIPDLREALKDPSPLVRIKVAEAVWTVERPLPSVILPVLTGGLADKEARVQIAAADVLGLMGGKASPAVTPLLKALASKDEAVQASVIDALGEIGPPARKAAPALLALLQDGGLQLIEPSIVVALSKMGPAIIPDLEGALADSSPRRRQAAAFALGLMGPAAAPAAPALINRLADQHPLVQLEAARALGKIDKEADQAIARLEPLLKAKQVRLRLAAAEALWRIDGRVDAIPLLAGPLQGQDLDAALDACAALGRIGSPALPAVPALIQCLIAKDNPALTRRAAEALGQIGPAAKKAVGPLLDLMKDRDFSHRASAALAHWRITKDVGRALPVLAQGLKEKDYADRWQAVQALGEMGQAAQPVMARLVELWEDEDHSSVRQALRDAARKIDLKAAARAGIR